MPTVQEIVDKIDRKYPNGATDAQKVDLIDTWQKRIFRKYRIPTSAEYEILADTYAYNLGIKPRLIFDVLVDGVSIPRKSLIGSSTDSSTFYTFIDNFIRIYPTPTEDGTLAIYYYGTPATVTSANMSAIPELDEDFHDLLVYGPCKELAEDDQRYDVSTGFAIQYTDLESDLSELFEVLPEVETVQVESGW
jgi:hypothetical protein